MKQISLWIFCAALIIVSITCSKKEFENTPAPVVTDSVLFISDIKQTDLNEFLVTYHFDNTQQVKVEDFGIDVSAADASQDKKTILLRKWPASKITGSFLLKELKGDAAYTVRLFTTTASKKDTFYSAARNIKSLSLQFVTRNQQIKFPRPINNFGLETNLPDTNSGVQSRMWIGDVECTIHEENGPFIIFSIPENVPYGYNTIKLQRKQLEAHLDSVYIFFGKSKQLGMYPEESPSANADYRVMYNVFQLNNKGYLFGGQRVKGGDITEDGGILSVPKYFFEYDGLTNSWTKIQYSTPVNFKFPMVQTANNEAYVVERDLWTKKADFPGEPRSYATAFVINDKAYVFGGTILEDGYIVGNTTNELWEYEPLSGQWRKINYQNGPEPLFSANSFAFDHKGYIVGGFKTLWSPGGKVNVPGLNW